MLPALGQVLGAELRLGTEGEMGVDFGFWVVFWDWDFNFVSRAWSCLSASLRGLTGLSRVVSVDADWEFWGLYWEGILLEEIESCCGSNWMLPVRLGLRDRDRDRARCSDGDPEVVEDCLL